MTRTAPCAIRSLESNTCFCSLGLRKEGTTKQQAPPELLEEVFEFNESLDELREARAEGGDVASLRANGSSKRKIISKKSSARWTKN